MSRCTASLVAAWAIMATPGCGGGGGPVDPFSRVSVSGTVKVDGTPVEFGVITFRGQRSENTQESAQTVLGVRNGEFKSEGASQGASAGENDVTITVYDADPASATAESPDVPLKGSWAGFADVQPGKTLEFTIPASDLRK